MTIYKFAKLSRSDKEAMLRNYALFIEQLKDGKNAVCVYFMDGFFVEVTIIDGMAVSFMPYQRGYKTNGLMPMPKQQSSFKKAFNMLINRKFIRMRRWN
jgi:hypothetical protein